MKARELDLFEFVAITARAMPDAVFTGPDDDWTPVVFMEGPKGRATMPIHEFMDDDLRKDMLTNILLPKAILEFEATTVVMVVSTWTAPSSGEAMREGRYLPPSQQPDRIEQVFVVEYTREGVTRQTWAKIRRFADKVPQLEEWEEMKDVTAFSGRFVDPIVEALKEVGA